VYNIVKRNNSFPGKEEFEVLKEQANILIKSGLLPKAVTRIETAIAIAIKGRELGVPIFQSFTHISIIEGKACISAELMLALIFSNVPQAKIEYLETSTEKCIISASRDGVKFSKFSFTMEDAKRAGLTTKHGWIRYPAAMLRARTVSTMARALFPDAIMGCSYTPEEAGKDEYIQDSPIEISGSVLAENDVTAMEAPSKEDNANSMRALQQINPSKEEDPFDKVITIGKHSGKRFSELKESELEEMRSKINSMELNNSGSFTEKVQDLLKNVSSYLEKNRGKNES